MSMFCATCFNYHRHTHTHYTTAMFKQLCDQEYTSTGCLYNHQKTTHQDTRLIEAYRAERANREKAETRIKSLEQEVELIRRQLEQFQYQTMTRLHNQHVAALANHKRTYNELHNLDESSDNKKLRKSEECDTVDRI